MTTKREPGELGQCQFSLGTSGPELVCDPSSLLCSVPASIFAFSQSNWGILLHLALAGIWSSSPCPHSTSWGYGGSMWRHWCCLYSRMDAPRKEVLSSVFSKRGHSLRCGWGIVARPSPEERWSLDTHSTPQPIPSSANTPQLFQTCVWCLSNFMWWLDFFFFCAVQILYSQQQMIWKK